MPFKLYNKIQKHLETVSHQEEKFDTKLLVNNLPYTLKNQLMFIIYGNIIKEFIFFKECQNSDFIIRILTSLIPNSAKKGAFIIHEGELIDNIIFVKQGRLTLVASIDLENPLTSINNYLGKIFEDINDKMNTNIDNSMSMNASTNNIGLKMEKAQTKITTLLKGNDLSDFSNIEGEIGKCNFEGDEFDANNYQFLNILDVLKNEHYGEVFMFLQKPSPLTLRVKSKFCELYLLRRQEVMQISKAYPNVWKKIYYKSYHNMKSLKRLTKKIVIQYCRNNGLKYDNSKDRWK
jgi:CRP-like cAMP-binding protein